MSAKLKSLIATIAVVVLASVGLSHGDGSHLTGTVASVDAKASTLTIQDGKQTTTINLTKSTKLVKDRKSATLADLKPGVRVTAHVQTDAKTKQYNADEVEIGVPEPTAKPAPPTPAPSKK